MRTITNKTLVVLGFFLLVAWMAPGVHAQEQDQTAGNEQASDTHSTDWYVDHAYDELTRYRTKVVAVLTHARELEDQNCYATAQGLLTNVGVAESVLREYQADPKKYVAKWNKSHPSDKATIHSMAKYIADQIVANSAQEGRSVLESTGCKATD